MVYCQEVPKGKHSNEILFITKELVFWCHNVSTEIKIISYIWSWQHFSEKYMHLVQSHFPHKRYELLVNSLGGGSTHNFFNVSTVCLALNNPYAAMPCWKASKGPPTKSINDCSGTVKSISICSCPLGVNHLPTIVPSVISGHDKKKNSSAISISYRHETRRYIVKIQINTWIYV